MTDRRKRSKAPFASFTPKAIPLALALCFAPGAYAACTVGNYLSGSTCVPADPGYYVGVAGATAETACNAGTFTAISGQSACSVATPGTFVSVSAATAAASCGVGSFTPLSGATACSVAAAGFFVGVVGATAQQQCSAGSFTNSVGQSACTLAPAGTFVALAGATSVQTCSAGTYSTSGQTACTLAPAGSFVSVSGASAASVCPGGTYQSSTGQTTCVTVAMGSFAAAGATASSLCTPGSFAANPGQSACTPASAGAFVSLTGASAQQACVAGTFTATAGQSLCAQSPAGFFVAAAGASAAAACAAGTFQALTGQTTCSVTPAGSYVGLTGQTASTLCAPGSYQPLAGQSACTLAGAGFFVASSGATSETACASGFTSSPGATQCTPIQYLLSVTKIGSGAGSVASSPAGIDCGATCAASFGTGTVVALTPTPLAGSIFSGWSGACTGVAACNVTLDASKTVTADFEPATTIPRLGSISTRGQVLTGDDVMIGGFIIGGSSSKTVVVRARGPSLIPLNVPDALANPKLTLVHSDGSVEVNDDWGSSPNASQIAASGFAPSDPYESAIMATLAPGAYTAIMEGVNGGKGVGIVEVYEVDNPVTPLAGISTRGAVLTGGDVMIGGFSVNGTAPQTVVVRARGPSLAGQGVAGALADTTLTIVRASDQAIIATNDNWGTAANAAQLQASGFAPADPLESAVLITLDPGIYTAILSGAGGATGIGIIEVFAQ